MHSVGYVFINMIMIVLGQYNLIQVDLRLFRVTDVFVGCPEKLLTNTWTIRKSDFSIVILRSPHCSAVAAADI